MTDQNSTETLKDISKQLADAYETTLEVNTMLHTLTKAYREERPGHMCEIILAKNEPLIDVLDCAARKVHAAAGGAS